MLSQNKAEEEYIEGAVVDEVAWEDVIAAFIPVFYEKEPPYFYQEK